ncbi:asparagine synthase (glutamine-hydrolyzing) [Anaerosolibacter carboniphilus]|uniref:asparagine synthase (glutamine-hydrolyzing) n=1 Tax=Anaerosolibacter carboniphilus TaxID=1417629 RepID=A0A841KSI1_9FIRM|nr:asparagine synthase-related protein [Anaerosolibacter carboniphilus]MBB6216377.1 asparagine synthase (glutamine-hydrolyzing) [Anaerosolibacter carboniphilus]
MIDIILSEHKAIEWQESCENYFRGWYFIDEEFYEKKETLIFFTDINEKNFEKKLKALNGNFSIVSKCKEKTYVAVDRIKSFPLLYTKIGQKVFISDNIETLKNLCYDKEIKLTSLQELIATGFVTGKKTIYNDIYQIQAGEYLIVDNKTGDIEVRQYYSHKHSADFEKSNKELCEELDAVLVNVFKRLIKSLNGKPVVLFLSGGYDSRLVAVMLKRLGYENMYCISFGQEKDKEVIAAKNVASTLGLKWYLINFSKNYFRKKLEEEEFREYIIKAANGICSPYYQGIVAEEFIKRGLIPKDAIFLTGNSGDVVEGEHFDSRFKEGKEHEKNIIIDSIIDTHYMIFGKKFGQKNLFRRFAVEFIGDKQIYSYDECHDICERFNWRERQSKYVINDVRCYDEYLGNEWRLPLWDNEFVEFWLRVPSNLRCNRKLYYEYVKNEKFLSANNKSLYRKSINLIKNHFMPIIEFFYPLEKLKEFIREKNPFYSVNLKDYLKILYLTKGYRTNTVTSHIFTEMGMLYNIKEITKLKELLEKEYY